MKTTFKGSIVVVASASCLMPLNATGQVHTTTLNVNANVNGTPFTITGNATYSASLPSGVTNTFNYSNIPAGYVSDTTTTVINTWKCTGIPPAKNLADACGGSFFMQRDIVIHDGPTVVGTFAVFGMVETTGANTGTANLTMTGIYTGPTDLTGVSGYHQFLHQVDQFNIEGHYTQQITRAGGPDLVASISNLWTFTSGPGFIGDQYSNLIVDSYSFNPGTLQLNLTGRGWYEMVDVPANPSGVGAASPVAVEWDQSTLLTVSVTPAANPASTGIAVSADLSSIGGSSSQSLFDDGTHGDATPGDNVFSVSAMVPSSNPPGVRHLPFVVSDAQSRTGTGEIAVTVVQPDTLVSFRLDFNTDGVFPPVENPNTSYFSPAVGHIDEHDAFGDVVGGVLVQQMSQLPGPNNGVSRYQSHAGQMDPSKRFRLEFRMRAITMGDDYDLCVFERDGQGDYNLLFSRYGIRLADGAVHYTDVTQFHTYVITSDGGTRFYRVFLDGVPVLEGNAGDVIHGENAFAFGDSKPGGSGWDVEYDYVDYQQFLPCGSADFNGDGDTGTDADIEAFFACLGGACCGTCFVGGSDFNGDGDSGTDADIESFFRVLAGGAC